VEYALKSWVTFGAWSMDRYSASTVDSDLDPWHEVHHTNQDAMAVFSSRPGPTPGVPMRWHADSHLRKATFLVNAVLSLSQLDLPCSETQEHPKGGPGNAMHRSR